MTSPEEIQKKLAAQLPGAEITVQDMTGTNDHFQVQVMWSGFNGKGLIQQHQLVNRALQEDLDSGAIHALKIKTYAIEGQS